MCYGLKSITTESNLTNFTFKNKHTERLLSTELKNYLNYQYKILIFHDTEIRIHHEADK